MGARHLTKVNCRMTRSPRDDSESQPC